MTAKRFYRRAASGNRFRTFTVCVKETDLWIAVSSGHYDPRFPAEIEQLVWRHRRQLEAFIRREPAFATALAPMTVPPGDVPEIAQSMLLAANRAGVGPMAAVAGAFAEFVGKQPCKHAPEVIVENGGDLFVSAVEPLKIGIYAGNSPLSGNLAIIVEPGNTPLGICTSSGTIGPSLSLGCADAALTLSASPPLADAAATAMGNLVRSPGKLEEALAYARCLDGIDGALIVCGEHAAVWGTIKLGPA